MKALLNSLSIACATGVLMLVSSVQADIAIDFSHDAATDNFFGTNTVARDTVLKAASDINALINSVPTEITAADYSITGSAGGVPGGPAGTTVMIDTTLNYFNPSTNATEIFSPNPLATNETRIFVGMQEFSDTNGFGDDTLGIGGPNGIVVDFDSSSIDGFNSFADALDDAEQQFNEAFRRGPTLPIINDVSGTFSGETYSLESGSTIGSLSFDIDTDNNQVTDSAAQLEAFFHFDSTTPVASGKIDFYTVAVHEILHSIGIGTSDSWFSDITGLNDPGNPDWTGAEVIAVNGTGVDLIAPDDGHIALGTMSTRLSDGMAQEVIMSPTLAPGERREFTALDAAFLRDIGWATNVASVPEPGLATLGSLVGLLLLTRRRRN